MTALLMSLLLAQAAYYTPVESQALFQEANTAYGKGDYAGARERYERLLEHGQGGADVLYNLGTTCLASGHLGEAVLYLERAKRAGGADDADVDGNLGVARSRQVDQVTGEAQEEGVAFRLAQAVPGLPVTATFAAAWATGWLLLALRRRWLGVMVLVLLAAPSGGLVLAHVVAERTVHEGVVMQTTVPAHELPSVDSKISFEVHAGLKVKLLQRSGDYARIRLPNGLEGWTERKAVTAI